MIVDILKKLLSWVTGEPVFIGHGFTTGEPEKLAQDPTAAEPKNLIFYKLKDELGVFEIRKVKHKTNGQVSYVVVNAADGSEFEINKKWFDYLFEEIVNSTVIEY